MLQAEVKLAAADLAQMKASLAKSQEVIERVMEESKAALRHAELRHSDLDFGATMVTLGEGSFGTVYRATLKGKHTVAVKTMRVSKVNAAELARASAVARAEARNISY